MYWQNASTQEEFIVPDDVVDLSFQIDCRCLPVDHAYRLSLALLQLLPWLAGEDSTGVHQILVANSQNGWMRPNNPDNLLYPSRRTRLVLRLPKARVEDARTLTGQSLEVAGHRIGVKQANIKRLSTITTLYSHYVDIAKAESEEQFLERVAEHLEVINVRPQKMLCGTQSEIRTEESTVHTRSLMLADLDIEESIRLQQFGIGPNRLLGCGLFIPHKDIKEVHQKEG